MIQNKNPNLHSHEDEIDLKEIFKILYNSKKLIITITLIITTLGAIYASQKAPKYKSTALIEIGQYNTFEKENIILEPVSNLIQNLKIFFIHKSNNFQSLSIKPIENKLIKIEIYKPSIDLSKKTLVKIIDYIEDRHSTLLNNVTQKSQNQLTYEIESLYDQIENTYSFLLNKKEKSLNDQIKYAKSRLITLDTQIESLIQIIIAEEENLLLLESNPELFIKRVAQSPTLDQVIFSYKSKLIDFENEKQDILIELESLEMELKLLELANLETDQIFKFLESDEIFINLSKEKDKLKKLELELEFLIQQDPIKTQLVGEIETFNIDTNKKLIIFLSFILGFFLSIIAVFINTFIKSFKEQ